MSWRARSPLPAPSRAGSAFVVKAVRGLCLAALIASLATAPASGRTLRAVEHDGGALARNGSSVLLGMLGAEHGTSCAERVQARYNCTLPGCTDLLDDTGCYINYIMLHQCTLEDAPWLGWIMLAMWQLFLMYMMGSTVDGFFCPALEVIVSVLHISPNLAGVTFLSFGNGSNDVFGSFSAFLSDQGSLAISAILGGGIFVTTVVVGTVALSSDVRLNRRPFLRDVGFYILAVLYLMLNFGHGTVQLARALGFVLIYVTFAMVVVVGRRVYQARKRARLAAEDDDDGVSLPTAVPDRLSVADSALGDTLAPDTADLLTPSVSNALNRTLLARRVPPVRRARAAARAPGGAARNALAMTSPGRVQTPAQEQRAQLRSPLLATMVGASDPLDATVAAAAAAHARAPARGLTLAASMARGLRLMPFRNRVRRAHHFMTALQLGEAAARTDAVEVAFDRVRSTMWPRRRAKSGSAHPRGGVAAPADGGMSESAFHVDTITDVSDSESESDRGSATASPWRTLVSGRSSRRASEALAEEVAALLHEEERAREEAAQEAAQGIVGRFIHRPLALALSVLLFPAWLVRRLSIPLLTEEEYDWRFVAATPAVGGPFVLSVVFGLVADKSLMLEPVIPGMPWLSWLLLSSVAGAALSALCFLRLPRDAPPSGLAQKVLMMFAFFGAVSWVITIAGEVVAVLVTLGTLLRISTAVLGLSVMAWGNSLGDLVADVAVARSGEPKMAVAACYAGPLFNMLIGMGLALSVGSLRDGSIKLRGNKGGNATIWVCFAFLLASLCSAIIVVPLDGFRVRRWFGYSLLGLYVTFLITALSVHFAA